MRGGQGYKVVDLTEYAWKRDYGGLTAYGTWFRDPEEGWQPCLIIAPSAEAAIPHITLAIIPHSDAYKWAPDQHIGDVKHQVEWIRLHFLPGLGFADDKQNVVAFMKIVEDVFDDFLKLPPRPLGDQFVAADAVLTTADGKQREIEVKEAL